jgi:hypothetical protein
VLEQQGLDNTPFALVAFNNDGNAHVHTSGQLRGLLDEQLIASTFEEAHRLSIQQARVLPYRAVSSGEFDMLTPRQTATDFAQRLLPLKDLQ